MSTLRSIGYEAEGERIRIGFIDAAGARSYRELQGPDKRRALEWVATRVAWLQAREPGVVVRSLRLKLDEARALLTLAGEPPRAITLEGSSYDEFSDGALEVVA